MTWLKPRACRPYLSHADQEGIQASCAGELRSQEGVAEGLHRRAEFAVTAPGQADADRRDTVGQRQGVDAPTEQGHCTSRGGTTYDTNVASADACVVDGSDNREENILVARLARNFQLGD